VTLARRFPGYPARVGEADGVGAREAPAVGVAVTMREEVGDG
jgi:hypothetical protein